MESKVNEVLEFYRNGKGFNCAQAIFSTYCEDFGLNKETALRLSCGLGGGMGRLGQVCGAVSGAILVIGLKHGKYLPDDRESKEKTYAMVHEFGKRFAEKNHTVNCHELLQVDLQHGDKQTIMESFNEICPRAVKDAAEILESILAKTKGKEVI
jgi:C_GCAxxG_C_C family probable redox protein